MKTFSRRTVLTAGAAVAASLATSSAVAADADTLNPTSKRKYKIVVTGSHPGDPEYGCGGTVARYAELGHDVTLLYLKSGHSHAEAFVRHIQSPDFPLP